MGVTDGDHGSVVGVGFVVLVAGREARLAFWRSVEGSKEWKEEDGNGEEVSGLSRETFARVFAYYQPMMCDRPMDVCIDDMRYLGYPTTVQGEASGPDILRSFNVVVALNRLGTDLGLITVAQRAVQALAVALLHEQKRENYLTEQLTLAGKRADRQSSLFETLGDLLHALQDRRTVHLMVNRWIEVSVPPPHPSPAQLIELSQRAIQPYQTFLPFVEDPQRRNIALPMGSAETLQRLLRNANPLRSFIELHTELDLPLATLLRAAAHLVRWNLGKIIDKVSKSSIYIVAKEADLHVDSQIRKDFERATSRLSPKWSFYSFLFSFSRPLTLESHHRRVGGNTQLMHEMTTCTVWLLRAGYLYQIRTFVYINLPSQVPDEPDNLYKALSCRSRSEEDVKLIWLAKYFNGQHHLEDIMWRENVARTQLERLLDKNSDVLVSCLHA